MTTADGALDAQSVTLSALNCTASTFAAQVATQIATSTCGPEDMKSTAEIINDTAVSCTSPSSLSGDATVQQIELELMHLNALTGVAKSFEPTPRIMRTYSLHPIKYFTGLPTLTGIMPPIGATTGGTEMTITGSNFVAYKDPMWMNRNVLSRKSWLVPFATYGEMSVRILGSDDTVKSVVRGRCPSGSCYLPDEPMTNVSWPNSSTGVMKFTMPESASADLVSVEVSMNGGGAVVPVYESTSRAYRYTKTWSVLSVTPPTGPTGASTRITIGGLDFIFQLIPGLTPPHLIRCKIAGRIVVPVSATGTNAICDTPVDLDTEGELEVGVTLNNQQYVFLPHSAGSTAEGASFSLTAPLTSGNVTYITPRYGPNTGGSILNISGYFGLTPNEVLRTKAYIGCRFGDTLTSKGWYVSPERIQCEVPALPGIGTSNAESTLAVYVAYEGQHFIRAKDDFHFIDDPQIDLKLATPNSGPSTGGTFVTISGGVFFNSTEGGPQPQIRNIRAKFGSYVHQSPCAFLNASLVVCESPDAGWATAASTPTVVQVSLSFDGGQSFSTKTTNFMYYKDATIGELIPTVGNSLEDTDVTIMGKGFQDTGGAARVHIIGRGHQDIFYQAAYYNYGIYVPAQSCATTSVQSCITLGKAWALVNCPKTCGFEIADQYVTATFINSTALRFVMPPQRPYQPWASTTNALATPLYNELKIALNGQNYGPDMKYFLHVAKPTITKLLPSTGPAYGGTSVTIIGNLVDAKMGETVVTNYGGKHITSSFAKLTTVTGSETNSAQTCS